MVDARIAEPEPPPPPDEAALVVERASGTRLLARIAIVLGAVSLTAVGAWKGWRAWCVREARSVPMVAFPTRTVVIGNSWRKAQGPSRTRSWRDQEEAPSGGLEERPDHPVEVTAFWLDTLEVSAARFAVCVEDGACTPAAKGKACTAGRRDREQHPANCVTFAQASAFCAWANKRLPTEVEWEYAAGGHDPKRIFPWGDELPLAKHANVCGSECTSGAQATRDLVRGEICDRDGCRPRTFDFDDGFPETAPVGSFPAGSTPEGIADLAGNVWEWTSSAPCVYPAHDCPAGAERVIRGGGWTHRYLLSPEVTTRSKMLTTALSDGVGFRCAR